MKLLKGKVIETPVLTSRTLDDLLGARAYLKCENFQRMGAFKFRGAYNAMSRLSEEARQRGVITHSSGNHAQAIALAGRMLGIATTIVMPEDAPRIKLAATREYGAEIITYDREATTREIVSADIGAERGLTLIPPYDHPHVIAGQGTSAWELISSVGMLDLLVVCCGGGGLLSGCALAAKHLSPGIAVIGVEPEAGDDATRSFQSGALHHVHNPETIADGARTPCLGEYTFPMVMRYVDRMVTVSDEELVRAMRFAMERMKIVVEPTGVLALAALLSGKISARGAKVGIIISGGNVDLDALPDLFARMWH
jgi:threonine dehydratase